MLLTVGYFVYSRFIRRASYDVIADLDPSAILDATELTMRERIGRGSFGDVYRAYWRHTEVAVKKIPDLNDSLYQELFEEARLMMCVRSAS